MGIEYSESHIECHPLQLTLGNTVIRRIVIIAFRYRNFRTVKTLIE